MLQKEKLMLIAPIASAVLVKPERSENIVH